MNDLRERLLTVVRHPAYRPVKPRSIFRRLKLPGTAREQFEELLDALQAARLIRIGRDGRVKPMSSGDTYETSIRRSPSGAGLCVVPDSRRGGQQEIWIAPEDMLTANTGDRVLVHLTRRRRRNGQRCGRVNEVLRRNTNRYVGTFQVESGRSSVTVDGKRFDQPFHVDDADGWQVQDGDKVQIEILRFPRHGESGDAVLVAVLDQRDPAAVDALSILSEFGLPDSFPEDVLEEARCQVDQFDDSNCADRLDLRDECIVTIDPVTAADFDDAISLKRSADGHWHLGVHIADVSHFVTPGSRLDEEAARRGTSVYLPQRVLPMLPRVISNGLASLQQGKSRLAKSVFIEFTADGVPVHREFANSIIRVTKRLAYEMVMPLVKRPRDFHGRVSANVRSLVHQMYELSRILRKRRMSSGSLHLVLPEVELEYDRAGAVVGARERVHEESHEVIEEFMLAANVAVATEFQERGITCLRRVHPPPSPRRMQDFGRFCSALDLPLQQPESRPELLALLKQVAATDLAHGVHFAFLKSLKQAIYSTEELGHFALAIPDYCHFTSPIRRYPDLLIHRQLQQMLTSRQGRQPTPSTAEQGTECSLLERRAERAERELVKIKLLRVMEPRVGESWMTRITGVERFGVFCRGVDLPAEGLLPLEAMGADLFDYDSDAMALVGRRTGRVLRLGEELKVIIDSVDIAQRELQLRLDDQSQTGRASTAFTDRPQRKLRGKSSGKQGKRAGKSGKSARKSRRSRRRSR